MHILNGSSCRRLAPRWFCGERLIQRHRAPTRDSFLCKNCNAEIACFSRMYAQFDSSRRGTIMLNPSRDSNKGMRRDVCGACYVVPDLSKHVCVDFCRTRLYDFPRHLMTSSSSVAHQLDCRQCIISAVVFQYQGS